MFKWSFPSTLRNSTWERVSGTRQERRDHRPTGLASPSRPHCEARPGAYQSFPLMRGPRFGRQVPKSYDLRSLGAECKKRVILAREKTFSQRSVFQQVKHPCCFRLSPHLGRGL